MSAAWPIGSEPASASTADLATPRAQLEALRRRGRWLMAGLAAGLVIATLLAVALGPVAIPLGDVLAYFLAPFGIATPDPASAPFVSLRLSRALLGLGVGASLGIAGATMQGLFRNPLADPGLIGVSSGARLGATAFIVLGGGTIVAASPAAALIALPAAAFVGALATLVLIARLARRAGVTQVTVLLLAGLALTVFEEAIVGLLIAFADDQALRAATLWRLGSLGGASMPIALLVIGVGALGSIVLLALARPLDALLVGEAGASHLGVPVERVKRRLIVASALIVATATAFVGIVGFVGLVVPHVVRLIAGPSHRIVLPASLLAGALWVLLADLVARTVVAPAELPLGVVTAFIGAPFFLWLVIARGRS